MLLLDTDWAWLVAREPLVAEDAVCNKTTDWTNNDLRILPLDTVWAWLGARDPLVAEDAESDITTKWTKNNLLYSNWILLGPGWSHESHW